MCQAVHTFHLFNKLFRECRDGFIELTTEACNLLTDAHRGVACKLIVVIEIIMNDWDCPHVFLDDKVSGPQGAKVSPLYELCPFTGDNWLSVGADGQVRVLPHGD